MTDTPIHAHMKTTCATCDGKGYKKSGSCAVCYGAGEFPWCAICTVMMPNEP